MKEVNKISRKLLNELGKSLNSKYMFNKMKNIDDVIRIDIDDQSIEVVSLEKILMSWIDTNIYWLSNDDYKDDKDVIHGTIKHLAELLTSLRMDKRKEDTDFLGVVEIMNQHGVDMEIDYHFCYGINSDMVLCYDRQLNEYEIKELYYAIELESKQIHTWATDEVAEDLEWNKLNIEKERYLLNYLKKIKDEPMEPIERERVVFYLSHFLGEKHREVECEIAYDFYVKMAEDFLISYEYSIFENEGGLAQAICDYLDTPWNVFKQEVWLEDIA